MKKLLHFACPVLIFVLILSLSVSAFAEVPVFNDIGSHWAKTYIETAYKNGWVNGVSDKTFDPDSNMTRAMLVTVLHRVDGEKSSAADLPFTDVPVNNWFTMPVRWAYENDIINGTGKTTFSPNVDITREQFVTILYRYASRMGYDVSASVNFSSFTDAKKISSYAVAAMKWAVGVGIINGRTDTELAPLANATRAEVTTMIYRFVEKVIKSSVQEIEQYTITFNTNGGSTVAAVTVKNGSTIDLSKYKSSKNGYTFIGWLNENGIEVKNITVTKDITVYASWQANPAAQYTLTFDTDGGSAVTALTVSEGTTIDLSKYTSSKSGYTFKGWKNADGTSVKSVTVTKDVTVYAVWEVVSVTQYTLSFSTNGGSEVSSVKVTAGTTVDLSKYTSSRSGYTFKGWKNTDGTSVKSVTVTKDMTVYAVWEIIPVTQYTLSFNTNGGSEVSSVKVDAGTIVDLSKYTSSKSGYTFKGWCDANGKTITSITMNNNQTVYASWTKINENETEEDPI